MKYINPNMKKIKNSFNLKIICAFCKFDICTYQKRGKGGVINLFINRIIESNIELTPYLNSITCPNCEAILGTRVKTKDSNEEAFRMIRGTFNIKK